MRPDRDRLNRLAEEDEISAPEMIDRLVEKEEQDRLLNAMDVDLARLRADEAAWSAFKAETTEWDTTSADTGAQGQVSPDAAKAMFGIASQTQSRAASMQWPRCHRQP